jgi:hypothetical protein
MATKKMFGWGTGTRGRASKGALEQYSSRDGDGEGIDNERRVSGRTVSRVR